MDKSQNQRKNGKKRVFCLQGNVKKLVKENVKLSIILNQY